MSEKEIAIRLHIENENTGRYEDIGWEYDFFHLANTVPVIGDLIVDPGVVKGLDRNNPANRTIYEVVARYFLPHAHGDDLSYAAIIVKPRPATDKEASITWVS